VPLPGFLSTHGSALLLPLSVIGGSGGSSLAGALSAQGLFRWYWALGLLVCGDLIGDLIDYWVGRRGRVPLGRLGRGLGLGQAMSPRLHRDLRQNATKMLLIGKWTHSLGCVILVGSGALRVPLPRFIIVNLLATVPKSAVLFGFGYYASRYWPMFQQHWVLGTLALCALGATAIGIVLWRAGGVVADGAGQ
jgi:membrane-associated protein